jgi:hypothetical protein
MVADMNTPFPARFSFATAYHVASRQVPAQPVTAKGLAVRTALLGLSVFAIISLALTAT